MTDDVAAVIKRARELVDPDERERAALERGAKELFDRAQKAVAELPVNAEVLRVGSTARDTWVAGDRDIDLFIRFPAELSREELTEYGLEVGHAVLPDGREQYAEHPYVRGEWNGFDIDIVPCYAVDDATDIQSAVDRTPFHNEYVREQIDTALAADARLTKGFCSGIGVYGSNLRTEGFSGYLIELLVIEYGGFRELLTAATDWTPQVRLDPADHGKVTFEDPLVVIDPTDPTRNVAAVLSAENVARFQHYAREFLATPSISFFTDQPTKQIDTEQLRVELNRRSTTPVALTFTTPDLIDDDLYPQMRTSQRGIEAELERRGFEVLRSTNAVTEDRSLLLFEFEVSTRPAIERHEGPPVHLQPHAKNFYTEYNDDPDVYGPFIDDDRYVVERPREFTDPVTWLRSESIFDVKHGNGIKQALENNYKIYVADDLIDLLPQFEAALGAYYDPRA